MEDWWNLVNTVRLNRAGATLIDSNSISSTIQRHMANIIDSPTQQEYGPCSEVILENDRKVISYWPYCHICKTPMDFEKDEPFAYCGCGTTEWGDPRPASWVQKPTKVTWKNIYKRVWKPVRRLAVLVYKNLGLVMYRAKCHWKKVGNHQWTMYTWRLTFQTQTKHSSSKTWAYRYRKKVILDPASMPAGPPPNFADR